MSDSSATGSPPPFPATATATESGKRTTSRIARVSGWLNTIYVVTFLLLIFLLSWWGERHWLLSLLLFAPPYALLLPLAILTPLCLVARPRLVLWQLLCTAVLSFGYMEFSWTRSGADRPGALKVITFNAGQGDRRQFQSFVQAEDPDLIILQDARNRGADYARTWPDRYVAGRGEFFLISRFPVQRADFVAEPSWGGKPVAARFEVLRDDKPFIVYNVHMPTPRGQFNRFLSRRAIRDLFGDEEHGKVFSTYREWVDDRIQLARNVAAFLGAEKERYIVCGDFNTPDHGYIHRILSRGLIDAHATAGQGWGLSFPGGPSGFTGRHGPWLRIDYAYAGRGWTPVFCRTDPGRRSQHRAVAAHFVPAP
jgi:endonuclease/exonuclease/phosphatase (EEP) superfamily protein YafD